MNLKEWLDKWSLSSLKINAHFLEMEWHPKDPDRDAAWELYIELITRISTQYMLPDQGDENCALQSVSKLFELTRDTIKRHGRHCGEFTKIAVVVLNQAVRPFTTKWHRLALNGALTSEAERTLFRNELSELQVTLRSYTQLLADLAGVDDLTDFSN